MPKPPGTEWITQWIIDAIQQRRYPHFGWRDKEKLLFYITAPNPTGDIPGDWFAVYEAFNEMCDSMYGATPVQGQSVNSRFAKLLRTSRRGMLRGDLRFQDEKRRSFHVWQLFPTSFKDCKYCFGSFNGPEKLARFSRFVLAPSAYPEPRFTKRKHSSVGNDPDDESASSGSGTDLQSSGFRAEREGSPNNIASVVSSPTEIVKEQKNATRAYHAPSGTDHCSMVSVSSLTPQEFVHHAQPSSSVWSPASGSVSVNTPSASTWNPERVSAVCLSPGLPVKLHGSINPPTETMSSVSTLGFGDQLWEPAYGSLIDQSTWGVEDSFGIGVGSPNKGSELPVTRSRVPSSSIFRNPFSPIEGGQSAGDTASSRSNLRENLHTGSVNDFACMPSGISDQKIPQIAHSEVPVLHHCESILLPIEGPPVTLSDLSGQDLVAWTQSLGPVSIAPIDNEEPGPTWNMSGYVPVPHQPKSQQPYLPGPGDQGSEHNIGGAASDTTIRKSKQNQTGVKPHSRRSRSPLSSEVPTTVIVKQAATHAAIIAKGVPKKFFQQPDPTLVPFVVDIYGFGTLLYTAQCRIGEALICSSPSGERIGHVCTTFVPELLRIPRLVVQDLEKGGVLSSIYEELGCGFPVVCTASGIYSRNSTAIPAWCLGNPSNRFDGILRRFSTRIAQQLFDTSRYEALLGRFPNRLHRGILIDCGTIFFGAQPRSQSEFGNVPLTMKIYLASIKDGTN
ncbi:interferon regulatory factor 4 [Colobine gammaherpesvirus 1]|uniref:Interferon regulatory factor 4 n=1 Tax=Colobine gammaherpesvirus 1 TaxID=2597325 RepID=A0A5B8FKE1_9GAMA|nr:interferon regulatory factor 4 [Colobine gammaherpesvirus 1]QDQ69266.1 interferon regulatory factor 4 [Colobine gammaherpesvirus 1]